MKRDSITDIENLINGLSLLRSHLVTVGHVRTMASVSHCTRKTATCAFARKVSREKIVGKVWNFVLDIQCERGNYYIIIIWFCIEYFWGHKSFSVMGIT